LGQKSDIKRQRKNRRGVKSKRHREKRGDLSIKKRMLREVLTPGKGSMAELKQAFLTGGRERDLN